MALLIAAERKDNKSMQAGAKSRKTKKLTGN
jgi:hypothetical protein